MAKAIAKGAVADGPVLFEADMGYQIDNMEGIDVWTRADGAQMVSLISDDNHSILQRNLYLEFVLHDEVEPQATKSPSFSRCVHDALASGSMSRSPRRACCDMKANASIAGIGRAKRKPWISPNPSRRSRAS